MITTIVTAAPNPVTPIAMRREAEASGRIQPKLMNRDSKVHRFIPPGERASGGVAFGPANFANLGSPTGGNTPQASSIGTPTWHVGDTWTYHVNSTPPDVFVVGPTWGSPSLEGTLARAVASADASQYNVTVHGSFHLGSVFDAARDGGYTNSSTLLF